MLGDIKTQIWGVLEIRGFVIRGFPFPQKTANCKDFLYSAVNKFILERFHTLAMPKEVLKQKPKNNTDTSLLAKQMCKSSKKNLQ